MNDRKPAARPALKMRKSLNRAVILLREKTLGEVDRRRSGLGTMVDFHRPTCLLYTPDHGARLLKRYGLAANRGGWTSAIPATASRDTRRLQRQGAASDTNPQ